MISARITYSTIVNKIVAKRINHTCMKYKHLNDDSTEYEEDPKSIVSYKGKLRTPEVRIRGYEEHESTEELYLDEENEAYEEKPLQIEDSEGYVEPIENVTVSMTNDILYDPNDEPNNPAKRLKTEKISHHFILEKLNIEKQFELEKLKIQNEFLLKKREIEKQENIEKMKVEAEERVKKYEIDKKYSVNSNLDE